METVGTRREDGHMENMDGAIIGAGLWA
jgi:hypothetical protein